MSGRTVGAHKARTSSARGYYSMPRGMRNRDADLSEGGGTDVERLQRKRMPSRRQGYPHGERILEGEKYSSERKRLNFMKTETRDLIMSDTNKKDFYSSISFLPDTEFCRRIGAHWIFTSNTVSFKSGQFPVPILGQFQQKFGCSDPLKVGVWTI